MAIKLSYKRCEEIKALAVNILKKYNIVKFPFDTTKLAMALGAKLIPYSKMPSNVKKLMIQLSEDGFTIYKNGEKLIYYNDKKPYERKNNTIGHECGHIVLDHKQQSELAEAEANFFAKYILVPPVIVHRLRLKNYKQIHDFFKVSYEAARYAFYYYIKRLHFGKRNYTNYEKQLLLLYCTNTS